MFTVGEIEHVMATVTNSSYHATRLLRSYHLDCFCLNNALLWPKPSGEPCRNRVDDFWRMA